ncbi:MAG: heavy metal translocating P-type ATPase, partial [Desulfotomaculaceae bacterium]|nr:heavy metal translocating P-type ATPase [Desulfotomaculaceae bacterium]
MERDIAKLQGVEKAELNFGAAKMKVQGNIDPAKIKEETNKHSVHAEVEGEARKKVKTKVPDGSRWQKTLFLMKNKWAMISVLAGLVLILGWTADAFLHHPALAIGLYLLTILIGGFATARKAFFSLRGLSFDMNVLMTVAVTGAVLIGEWGEGAVIAFLFSVSGALESFTFDRARQSIRSLMEIAPLAARIRREGRETELPVEEIRPGDILLVKPGEKIAMDGKVLSGYSAINQAAITGESAPVNKVAGDEVYAGTLNLQGALEVEVTRLVKDTTIARIIEMVEEAQAQRAPSQTFVDKFARIYTPVVIALAAGIAVLPPLLWGVGWYDWIYRGLALLVVSCPCALVVSTPVAIVSAIGSAAKHGVLIKGGAYLEETGALSVVAFDKTGTLTKGVPAVTDIITVGEINEQDLFRAAASVEKLSEHPLAGAVVQKAKEKGIEPERVVDFKSLTGKGAWARLDGKKIVVGSPKLFSENKIDLSAWKITLENLWSEGKTAILVEINGKLAGILAVADTVRETSRYTVDVLKTSGVKTVMLTGDNTVTAEAIAAQIGVDDFVAELLPEDKVKAVKGLLARYGKVAMVGDGINDAPALATATVGIAMGGAGTDTALETADIVLMSDDLSRLPFAIRLSRAALGV